MEEFNNQGTIGSDYIIINKKGSGASSNVYIVKGNANQELYAAKVLKTPSPLFQNEINILNTLRNVHNPYLIKMISSGEGIINRKNKLKKRQYIILENASNGELVNYIYHASSGLNERLSKLIFSKILKGIQACHNIGICHRDLKMQNILLNEDYIPKICDFGFAIINNNHLTDYLGTARYAAPEILKGKPYDGFKADIFSLGVVLLTLTTCKFGFIRATLEDKYYKYIAEKKYEQYWKNLGDKFPKISEELKNLFIKMIAYQPKERPSIEEILNSSWMKEINNLNQDELEQLEKELKEEFLKRQPLVDAGLKEDEIKLEQEDSEESSGNKGSNNNYENYFDLNLKPKYEQSGINMNNYIKLKGNEINPAKFMNMLIDKIKNRFNLLNDVEINEKKFKFNVTFNEENEDLNEEEEENENIKGNKTNIEIKIYESYNGGYLLRFVKKEGEISNYLDILKKIYALITNK